MRSSLVVAAVAGIATIAAADALRAPPEATEPVRAPAGLPAPTGLPILAGEPGPYALDGRYLRERVLEGGEEHLAAEAIAAAFPALAKRYDLYHVQHLAVAPNGTLVLAVLQFPASRPARAAIELWREGEAVGAFGVLPGSFAGGLGFTAEGRLLIAGFSAGRRQATLYDWQGRFVERVRPRLVS